MAPQDKAPKKDKKPDVDEAETDALDSEESRERDADADAFWEKVGVAPIEIAMPKGVGLTLRAYRMSDEVEEDEPEEDEPEESEEDVVEEAEEAKGGKKGKRGKQQPEEDDEEDEDVVPKHEDLDADEPSEEDFEDEDEEEDEEPEDDDEEVEFEAEEVPIFLSHRGKLPLFESAEALVAYVKSDAPTDLAVIDTWDELVKDIKVDYVVADEADVYELDLVVKNLRGGHDSWEPELVIGAGELARDLGYALRNEGIMSTLGEGSPLDKLDNALRDVAEGGLRAMFARRKLRKVGTQQSSLAWRGIINKIGDAVDWRK
ncbi:MAG: DNA primase [Stackebrandtia sp.]